MNDKEMLYQVFVEGDMAMAMCRSCVIKYHNHPQISAAPHDGCR
jgi:hypothetical protein